MAHLMGERESGGLRLDFDRRLPELHGYPVGLRNVGDWIHNETRFQADRGDYGPGDKDELIKQLIATYRIKAKSYERTIPNGQTLHFNVGPTPAGGYIPIATHITERKCIEGALMVAKLKTGGEGRSDGKES